MISRGQRILFWILLGSSVLMAVVLLRMRERAMDRLLASAETSAVFIVAAAFRLREITGRCSAST